MSDSNTRFVFENADIRGNVVHLTASYRNILDIHQYPPPVAELLGEFLVAVTLLSSTIKFHGSLSLQVSQPGGAAVIMAQSSSRQELRAIVRGYETFAGTNFFSTFSGGQLAITIEPEQGPRYQGLVDLAGDRLGNALESYFAQSEQLATRIWLTADSAHGAGMLLQQLPEQLSDDATQRAAMWEHACKLAETITPAELRDLAASDLLYRLYHQEEIRLYPATKVAFRCTCSRQRTAAALATLPRAELEDILQTEGCISMDCEFCNTSYKFDQGYIAELFGDPDPGLIH